MAKCQSVGGELFFEASVGLNTSHFKNESPVTTCNLLTHLKPDQVHTEEASISQVLFPANSWENRLNDGRR